MADQLQEILEIVQFIKDHGASKDDLKDYATKADIALVRGDIVTINQRLDHHSVLLEYHGALLATIQQDLADVKTSLNELEKKWKEESDMYGPELVALKERVNVLEKEVRRLQSVGNIS